MANKVKIIIIIGCGRMGSELALKLCKDHNVIVIDKNEKSFERLTKNNFVGFTKILDTNDMAALMDLDLERTDMVYIVTPDDNLNFMLAYGIKKLNKEINIATRVNDPAKKAIFTKANLEFFCPIEDSVKNLVKQIEEKEK